MLSIEGTILYKVYSYQMRQLNPNKTILVVFGRQFSNSRVKGYYPDQLQENHDVPQYCHSNILEKKAFNGILLNKIYRS